MLLPVIQGTIDRRILANFRVDPIVASRFLPPPFKPKVAGGYAIGGICLIRLTAIRPRFLPLPLGVRSENAAHRFAVQWKVDGQSREGVFIPRRDTNSRFNVWAGGRVFPGVHHYSTFDVRETPDHLSVSLQSHDGKIRCHVSGVVAKELPKSSVFSTVEMVSQFFQGGSLGYSVTLSDGRYEGLELRCNNWHVEPLQIDTIQSSFFEDESVFPRGSVEFDCALIMRGIKHEWHSQQDLCCNS